MNHRTRSRFLIAVVALMFAVSALAQEKPGFYAGAAVGQATVKDFCNGASSAGISCKDHDTAWRAFGGYQLNPNFALEGGFIDLGKVNASIGGARVDVKGNALDVVGVGSVPFGKFSPYGKLGLYRASSEVSSNFGFSQTVTNTGLTYGAGVRFDFTDRLAVRGEWQRFADVGGGDIGKGDVDVLSIGLLVKF